MAQAQQYIAEGYRWVLYEFGRELQRRSLRFARYADDSNTYVRSPGGRRSE